MNTVFISGLASSVISLCVCTVVSAIYNRKINKLISKKLENIEYEVYEFNESLNRIYPTEDDIK